MVARVEMDFTDPVENTVRKVMITRLLERLDAGLRATTRDERTRRCAAELEAQGVSSLIVKGSAENCLPGVQQSVPRNPRDLDLVLTSGHNRPNGHGCASSLRAVLQASAAIDGMECADRQPATLRDRMTHRLLNKQSHLLTLTLTDDWLNTAIRDAGRLRLNERDMDFLRQAKAGRRVNAKVDITMNEPVPDQPPYDPARDETLRRGVGTNALSVSLLGKLQAVNHVLRITDRRAPPMLHASDAVDLYNLTFSQRGGRGLNSTDMIDMETVITRGHNYPQRQRRQKVETLARRVLHGDFRSVTLRDLVKDRDRPILPPPDDAAVEQLERELGKLYEANLIAVPVSREMASDIAREAFEMSRDVLGEQQAATRAQYRKFPDHHGRN